MKGNNTKVIVVGGGAAGMIASWFLASRFDVHLFEKESRVGKKMIVAGKGGLNITNNASLEKLLAQYTPTGFMDGAVTDADNTIFRQWLLQIGIPTYVGSSGKVFPQKDITALQVVNTLKDSLISRGVVIHTHHKMIGFLDSMNFTFENEGITKTEQADFAVMALGGASWPQTGSDGKWTLAFNERSIHTLDFQASNCGIEIEWNDSIKNFHAGKPLKNIVLSVGTHSSKGEALITEVGLEGTAVYALIPAIRNNLSRDEGARLTIDFKPLNTKEQLTNKIKTNRAQPADYKEVLSLSSAALAILKSFTAKNDFIDPERFCSAVKHLEVPVKALRPVEEAISVVGGIDIGELNMDFSLKKYPKIFVAGEMINWDAPTGGYLLQGCFSMGKFIGETIGLKH